MKFLNFLLSFIIPNKMENRRDMNLFIAILLYLFCALMVAGIPNFRITKIVKDRYLTECYCFEETFNTELTEEAQEQITKLPIFELRSDNSIKLAGNELSEDTVFEMALKTKDGDQINLTIVYLPSLTNDQEIPLSAFDLDKYLKVNPFNENHELVTKDVLAIYTNKVFYFIFNHGYTLNYQGTASDANLEDYHYLYVPNWESAGDWSLYLTAVDEEGKIKKDINGKVIYKYYRYDEDHHIIKLEDGTIDYELSSDEERYSERIYNPNINKIFAHDKQSNIGMYSYLELQEQGINVLDLRNVNPLEEFSETVISSCITSIKTTSYILSLFFNVLLPLIWVFVLWLLLHKNGELTSFKEYYAIGAASMVLPSIITSIVGLFIPYTIIARIAMVVTALYFLVNILIINNMGRKRLLQAKADGKLKKDATSDEPEEIETTPISDVVENLPKEDNKERPGRIG